MVKTQKRAYTWSVNDPANTPMWLEHHDKVDSGRRGHRKRKCGRLKGRQIRQ